jgi:hypothetical protein
MEGFFDLRTPTDLLRKLAREHERWQADPLNTDLAWNFFVTAEHLPDWLARAGGPRLPTGFSYGKFKREHPLLRICSHLASGGKHFTPRENEHRSVTSTRQREGWVEEGWIERGWVEHEALMVDLTPDEQQALSFPSASIEALPLAAQVLAFWQQYLSRTSGP